MNIIIIFIVWWDWNWGRFPHFPKELTTQPPTSIRPVVVCPEISSPAQSLASVINVPSNSCLPCLAAFCSFCLGSFGPRSASLRQHRNANARHINTISNPARNVQMLDKRKHQYLRTARQSGPVAVRFEMEMKGGSLAASSLVIPRGPMPRTEASTWFRWCFTTEKRTSGKHRLAACRPTQADCRVQERRCIRAAGINNVPPKKRARWRRRAVLSNWDKFAVFGGINWKKTCNVYEGRRHRKFLWKSSRVKDSNEN